ncbi:MAG: hypothetical protein HOW73_16135 [Polyangiaceae bacterium]|nr:hypothetical protein [Polyangiaceae bacterium]
MVTDETASGGAGASGGGVATGGAAEWLSVEDSAECAAYCDKVEALPCDVQCNTDFVCAVPPTWCAESKRAYLQCKVDHAEFSCNDSGGYHVTPADCCPDDACERNGCPE